MKHLLLFIVVTFGVFTFSARAQNVAPYWSLVGNSNATTASKFGTTNAIPIRFLTNKVERMRLDPGGRLGLGTVSPLAELDVNITSGYQIARFNSTQPKMYIGLYKSANLLGYIGSYGGAAKDVDFGTTTFNPGGKTHLTTQALPRLTVDSIGRVGVGTTSPSYKFQVEGGTGLGIYAHSSSSYAVYGNSGYLGVYGYGTTYGVYGSGSTYGVYGSGSTYGLYGSGSYGVYGSGNGYGVYGNASSNGVYGNGYNGVYGNSPSGNGVWGNTATGYGVVGNASSSGIGGYFQSATGYGVVGKTSNSSANWAGVFYGNVYSSGAYQTSDKRLKKNIAEFTDAMSIISQLKPRTYEFQTDGKMAELNLPQGKHYGLIAQDVETVLPNLVKEVLENPTAADQNAPSSATNASIQVAPQDPNTKITDLVQALGAPINNTVQKKGDEQMIKVVNYIELIPLLIKGMQEQQKRIEDLEQMVSKLQNGNTLSSATISGGSLGQNAPNPYNGSSLIRYQVPQNAGSAKLVITDARGALLKTINLGDRGNGQVTFDGNSLPAGTYNYSLWIDNKQVDTKQMIVVK